VRKVSKLIENIISGMSAKLEKLCQSKSHLPVTKLLGKCLGFMLHPTINAPTGISSGYFGLKLDLWFIHKYHPGGSY